MPSSWHFSKVRLKYNGTVDPADVLKVWLKYLRTVGLADFCTLVPLSWVIVGKLGLDIMDPSIWQILKSYA